jgi:hypothetical protein
VTGGTISTRLGWLLAAMCALNVFALTLLCYASPPDQTWIAGLYDNADHDDVVVEILDTCAVPPAPAPRVHAPDSLRETPPPALPAVPSLLGRGTLLDRSPPLA